jgi:CRISPR-associated protein Cmr6
MHPPYSGINLLNLLEKQHQKRSTSDLFRSGVFTLNWRTKVGSFTAPDLETIIAAGEPCGPWGTIQVNRPNKKDDRNKWIDNFEPSRPEDKRNVGENNQEQAWPKIPLHGYIPAASIRGIVRSWANQHPIIQARMRELLGWQDNNNKIIAGKIEFLDAFPEQPTKLSLDIVNPQQDFQVFHEGQSKPVSLYTLGDGYDDIKIKVAIQGIAGKASAEEVAEVWNWVQQALALHGLGSRTASGYGAVSAPADFVPPTDLPKLQEGYESKKLSFTLYSQGNSGPDMEVMELRPSHLRGWLRSWLLRFFLGVMSVADAKYTVGELLGTLQESTDGLGRKGCVGLKLTQGNVWGTRSEGEGYKCFYKWQGSFEIIAPARILNKIILPILKFAVMIGGVGRGWRRPLHLFVMKNGNHAARGCHVIFRDKDKKLFGLASNPENWQKLYANWVQAVTNTWTNRFDTQVQAASGEVFSPHTCAIYVVNGPEEDPLEDPINGLDWSVTKPTTKPTTTRGSGMDLIYKSTYKRKPDVGGNAAEGQSNCSWVSIKRSKTKEVQKEIVCIFMGQDNLLRRQFLKELHDLPNSIHLFGITPPQSQE